MRRLAALVAVLAVLPVLAACRPHTVTVAFRPEVGATYRYEVRVRATSTTELAGAAPERRDEEVRLIAEHTVLASNRRGVRVRVLVGEPGTAAQVFVVRLDRAAQLESIESTEGAPEEITGALGVPEIFPGAVAAPPTRGLAPGDRWTVDRRILVPGASAPSRLRISGRLVELGLAGQEEVARLDSVATFPFRAIGRTPDGIVVLDGRQRIEQRATYDLADGAVRSVTATTTGHFTIEVQPPVGTQADPVPGTLTVRVRSETRRI